MKTHVNDLKMYDSFRWNDSERKAETYIYAIIAPPTKTDAQGFGERVVLTLWCGRRNKSFRSTMSPPDYVWTVE